MSSAYGRHRTTVHANSSRLLSSEGKDTGSDQGTCLPPLAPTKPVVQLEGRNLLELGGWDGEFRSDAPLDSGSIGHGLAGRARDWLGHHGCATIERQRRARASLQHACHRRHSGSDHHYRRTHLGRPFQPCRHLVTMIRGELSRTSRSMSAKCQ